MTFSKNYDQVQILWSHKILWLLGGLQLRCLIIPNVKTMINTLLYSSFCGFLSIFRAIKVFNAHGFLYFVEAKSPQAKSLKYNCNYDVWSYQVLRLWLLHFCIRFSLDFLSIKGICCAGVLYSAKKYHTDGRTKFRPGRGQFMGPTSKVGGFKVSVLGWEAFPKWTA